MGKPKAPKDIRPLTREEMVARREKVGKKEVARVKAETASMGRVVAPRTPTDRFVTTREPTGRTAGARAAESAKGEIESLTKQIEAKDKEAKDLEARKRIDILGDARRGRRTRGGGGGGALRSSILTSAAGVTDKGSGGKRKTILGS